jgi:TP901 family phage tail tape measure protein
MASLQDTIDILIRVNDQASAAIGNIGDALSGVDGKVQAVAAPFASMADKVLLAQGAITGLGVALVKTGVDEAGKFEQSFKFITTLFEGSSESVSKFRQDILDYASGSTQSLDSITNALQEAIGAGVDYSESLGVLAEAEKLAVAQGATLDETTGLLTDTLQAYGLTMDDASKLSNQFSVAIRDGKISASELASQLSNVSPIAAATGVGFDQVGSAIAVLTTQGYKAGPAITAIKAILEGIVRPTADASKYADELGISFGSTALKSDGLQGVLQKVYEATGGNVDAMARLFTSSEALGGALALGGNGAEKFKEILVNMTNAAGATDDAFKKMGGTIEAGAQKIENALKVAFVNIGTPLLDELSGLQGEVAAIFAALGKEFTDGGAFRPITQALEALGVDIKDVLASIARNLPDALDGIDLTDLIGEYGELGKSIQGLFTDIFGDMDLTTVDGLRRAVETTIETLKTLTTVTRGIVDSFRPAAEAIGETVNKFNALDEESKLDFGETIGSMKLLQEVGTGLGVALIAIGRAGVDMGVVLDGVFGAVKVAVNTLQVAFDSAVLGILSIAKAGLEVTGFEDKARELQAVMDAVAANGMRNARELESGWNQMTGQSAQKTDEWRAKLNAAEAALKSTGSTTREAGSGIKDFSDHLMSADDIIGQLPPELQALAGGALAAAKAMEAIDNDVGLKAIADGAWVAADKTDVLKTETGALIQIIRDADGNITGYTQRTKGIGGAMSEAAKKTKEATEESESFKLKWEELTSNERLKTLEFGVQLKATQMQTDAERVSAAFSSIGDTIGSTSDGLSSLYQSLTDADTWFEKSAIMEGIQNYTAWMDDQLSLQEKLVEAEIKRIEAQTERLAKDDAVFKIDATGLEPEIEAFMWKILGKIQVRANASLQDYLLGIDSAT